MTDHENLGLQAVAKTTGQFANKFLKTVATENPGNLIASPLSAQVVLAMAAYGAGGRTATQMRSALHIPSDDLVGQFGYRSLIETLNDQKGVELRLANKIFTSMMTPVKSEFEELTAEKFLSESQEVDFSDAKGTADTINAWCEEETNQRIKDLITPDSLSQDTMLILVNAVYFKGQWKNKFNPTQTQNRPFHVDEKTIINVPTMYIKEDLRFGDIPELKAQVIEVPYQGEDMSMIIILPNDINGLGTVRENLHKVDLGENLKRFPAREVELFLPKFKIESTLDLKSPLQKLGMTDMFENNADFSGITDERVKVSKVIQKAFIEVNEEGSEAAGATGMQFMLMCARCIEFFNANHPFYYQIRSATLNVPIFAGLYTARQ